jgi:hypothetical protein
MRGTLIALAGMAALAAACGPLAAGSPHHTHHRQQSTKPPDAYIAVRSGHRVKMGLGSSCWTATNGSSTTSVCGDSAGWSYYPGLPRISAAAGDRVTVAFGFTPTRRIAIVYARHSTYLPPSRNPTLTVPGSGILEVDAIGSRGDVSYGIRIVPDSR